jgi:small subunit ribosomal protein S16
MLTIRLQRIGKRKQPYYRLIISEKGRDTQAKSLEILGNYGPTEVPKVLSLNVDRIKYWLSVGAQTSNTIHNLFVREGIIKADKKKSVTITNKRKAKIDKKKTEAEAKIAEAKQKELEAKQKAEEEAKVAEEAKKAEAEAAKAVAETPVETPTEEIKTEETPVEEVKVEETKTEETKSE